MKQQHLVQSAPNQSQWRCWDTSSRHLHAGHPLDTKVQGLQGSRVFSSSLRLASCGPGVCGGMASPACCVANSSLSQEGSDGQCFDNPCSAM